MTGDRTQSLHAVHRMMQATVENPGLRSRLGSERNAVFADFRLSDEEIEALNECTFASLAKIGMHPMYRMHWMMLANPGMASYLSVEEYLDKAKAEAADG